jgi:hypothetical protein
MAVILHDPTHKISIPTETRKIVLWYGGPQISVSSQANAAGFKAGTQACIGRSVYERMMVTATMTTTDDHRCGGEI